MAEKLNGLPILSFPGNCYFNHPYSGELGTWVALIRPSGIGNYCVLFGAKGDSRQLPYAAYYVSTCQPNGKCGFERTDYNGNPVTINYPMRLDEWNVWSGKVESSFISYFLNGYLIAKAEILSFSGINNAVLGASWYNNSLGNYWVGEFAEMAIYSQPLTNKQIGSIVTYLRRKYSL